MQGVGFRFFVEQTAAQLGINVRADNMDDGTVRVIASGDEQRLLRLVEVLRQVFHHSETDATRIMLHVHHNGVGIAGVGLAAGFYLLSPRSRVAPYVGATGGGAIVSGSF